MRPRDGGAVRVCHVMSADLWAGAEVQVAAVASYLAAQPDVQMSAVLFNDGPLAGRLRHLGIAVTVIDEQRHNSTAILVRLARHLRLHPVDVVHTHRYKDTVLGALAARLAGVPCVYRTVHGWSEALSGWSAIKLMAYDALDRAALRCLVDRIIAVSRQVAGRLERSGCSPRAIVPLPNGVVLRHVRATRARDAVRQSLGIDRGAPLIGTVGRLSPVKGHAVLLQAARRLLDREPAARVLIVGDGPLGERLRRTAKQLAIDSACRFAGARADVYDLVAAMDVFVLPSLDEGIPMALLEAMALGVPVVATAVGGVPEVVAHRRSGLLVAPADERALATACAELLADRVLAASLAAEGRRTVEDDFSHETNGQALVRMYRRSVDEAWTLTAA